MIAGVLLGVACRKQAPDVRQRSLAVYPARIKGEPTIRVLIQQGVSELSLSVTGAYRLEVVHLDGRAETGGGQTPVTVRVRPTERGIQLGKDEVREATISPLGDTDLMIDGEAYPGGLSFHGRMRTVGARATPVLDVVMRLGIEEYLVGVLPNEMQANWPVEALRAQAVASRTYALYHILTRRKKTWDVKSSVDSQVWRPSRKLLPRVNMAVNSTVGVVLSESNAIFPAYFHSRCGGRTADANPVFLQQDIVALTGVSCPLCAESGEAVPRWTLTLTRSAIAERLRKRDLMQGELASVRKLDKEMRPSNAPGRAYWVELTSAAGVRTVVNANDFRLAIGGGRGELESTWFTVVESPDRRSLIFEGYGFGHGVGLCQYGAKYLAEAKGYAFDAILARYYMGAKPVRLWGGAYAASRTAGAPSP